MPRSGRYAASSERVFKLAGLAKRKRRRLTGENLLLPAYTCTRYANLATLVQIQHPAPSLAVTVRLTCPLKRQMRVRILPVAHATVAEWQKQQPDDLPPLKLM